MCAIDMFIADTVTLCRVACQGCRSHAVELQWPNVVTHSERFDTYVPEITIYNDDAHSKPVMGHSSAICESPVLSSVLRPDKKNTIVVNGLVSAVDPDCLEEANNGDSWNLKFDAAGISQKLVNRSCICSMHYIYCIFILRRHYHG